MNIAPDDGAASIKCHDPNCPCQQTDKREPLRVGPAPGRPSEAQRSWKGTSTSPRKNG